MTPSQAIAAHRARQAAGWNRAVRIPAALAAAALLAQLLAWILA